MLAVLLYCEPVAVAEKAERLHRDEQEMFYGVFEAAFEQVLRSAQLESTVTPHGADGLMCELSGPDDVLRVYHGCTLQFARISYGTWRCMLRMGAVFGEPVTLDTGPRGGLPRLAKQLSDGAAPGELLVDAHLGELLRGNPLVRDLGLLVEPSDAPAKRQSDVSPFRIRSQRMPEPAQPSDVSEIPISSSPSRVPHIDTTCPGSLLIVTYLAGEVRHRTWGLLLPTWPSYACVPLRGEMRTATEWCVSCAASSTRTVPATRLSSHWFPDRRRAPFGILEIGDELGVVADFASRDQIRTARHYRAHWLSQDTVESEDLEAPERIADWELFEEGLKLYLPRLPRRTRAPETALVYLPTSRLAVGILTTDEHSPNSWNIFPAHAVLESLVEQGITSATGREFWTDDGWGENRAFVYSDAVREMSSWAAGSGSRYTAIVGPPKHGKTSLLRRLLARDCTFAPLLIHVEAGMDIWDMISSLNSLRLDIPGLRVDPTRGLTTLDKSESPQACVEAILRRVLEVFRHDGPASQRILIGIDICHGVLTSPAASRVVSALNDLLRYVRDAPAVRVCFALSGSDFASGRQQRKYKFLQSNLGRTIHVAPFSRNDVVALCRRWPSGDAFGRRVFELAGGHPAATQSILIHTDTLMLQEACESPFDPLERAVQVAVRDDWLTHLWRLVSLDGAPTERVVQRQTFLKLLLDHPTSEMLRKARTADWEQLQSLGIIRQSPLSVPQCSVWVAPYFQEWLRVRLGTQYVSTSRTSPTAEVV